MKLPLFRRPTEKNQPYRAQTSNYPLLEFYGFDNEDYSAIRVS